MQSWRPEDLLGDNRWMSMHSRYIKEAQITPHCDILLIGDSIVQQMQFTNFYEKNLPKGKITLNFGIGGDKVENVLWRIEDANWLEKLNPTVVVLFAGTNNITSSPQQITDLLDTTIKAIKMRSPKAHIILPLLLPRGQFPNKLRDKNQSTNTLLCEKFKCKDSIDNVHIVDMEGLNKIINEDGTISHLLLHDYLHLTEDGYSSTWNLVFDKCKEILDAGPS